MAMAEYPSQTFTVSKLLARKRKLRACRRSGSSSTTMIFARFTGCPSASFSVRMLLILLFRELRFVLKTFLYNFVDAIGNRPDLLLYRPRVRSGRNCNRFASYTQGTHGLQLRQRSDFGAAT